MKALAERIAKITGGYRGVRPSHRHQRRAGAGVPARPRPRSSGELKLAEPIPKLCTLVTASPFDAAMHDAFGKVHGLNCYHTYGPEFMRHDLGALPRRRSSRASTWTATSLREPQAAHAALPPGRRARSARRCRRRRRASNDGLPETLPEWIRYNGLTHLKIKLNGDDLDWDVERVLRVDRVAGGDAAAARRRALVLLARLQREVPERRLPARLPAPGEGEDAARRSTASSTSSSRRRAT